MIRNNTLRLLSRWGLKSSSDPHESSIVTPHDPAATPIVVLGFARTGTTTIQSRLAKDLGYNYCFEPFSSKGTSHADVPDVNHWFMGVPPECHRARLSRSTGCALAPDAITDANWKASLRNILREQISAIHDIYGWNCVWKEIRLVPTLPSIMSAYDSLARTAKYVGVIGNPLGCTYAYYRLLALGKSPGLNGLHPGSIWTYRKAVYKSQGIESDLFDIHPQSPAEDLIIASLADQEFLRSMAQQSPKSVFLTQLSELSGLAARLSGQKSPTASKPVPLPTHTPKWAGDPWFHKLVIDRLAPNVTDALTAQWGYPELVQGPTTKRAWWTSVLNSTIGGL